MLPKALPDPGKATPTGTWAKLLVGANTLLAPAEFTPEMLPAPKFPLETKRSLPKALPGGANTKSLQLNKVPPLLNGVTIPAAETVTTEPMFCPT